MLVALLVVALTTDGAAPTVAARIGMSEYPTNLAVSPDGSRVYATDSTSNTLLILDATYPDVEPSRVTLDVDGLSDVDGPSDLALSQDGSRAYLVDCGQDGRLAVIDIADPATDAQYLAAGAAPCTVALAPDGGLAYTTSSRDSPLVTMIDLTSPAAATTTIFLDHVADGVFPTPDGRQLYVVHALDDQVSVVDVAAAAMWTTFTVPDPRSVAFSPDGGLAFITSNAGQVLVVDVGNPGLAPRVVPVAGAGAIALSDDGRHAVVAGTEPGTVTVIDVPSLTVVGGPIPVGDRAGSVAITRDGRHAYVADLDESSSVVVVELPVGG